MVKCYLLLYKVLPFILPLIIFLISKKYQRIG